jgi:hypothetical protein
MAYCPFFDLPPTPNFLATLSPPFTLMYLLSTPSSPSSPPSTPLSQQQANSTLPLLSPASQTLPPPQRYRQTRRRLQQRCVYGRAAYDALEDEEICATSNEPGSVAEALARSGLSRRAKIATATAIATATRRLVLMIVSAAESRGGMNMAGLGYDWSCMVSVLVH